MASGLTDGYLDAADGARTNYTDLSGSTGTVALTVESALDIDCNETPQVLVENATTTGAVIQPLLLQDVALAIEPNASGSDSDLTLVIDGGEPPYELRVTWGDGSISLASDAVPGRFALAHSFPSGEFLPTVQVTDRGGSTASCGAAGPILVRGGLALAIDGTTTEVDPGVVAPFAAVLLHAVPEGPTGAYCNGVPTAGRWIVVGSSSIERFACSFDRPGPANVSVQLFPTILGSLPLATQYTVEVGNALSLTTDPPVGASEVGRPQIAPAWILGGVPPFVVRWQAGSNVTGATTNLSESGGFGVPIQPVVPGEYTLHVNVTDSLGENRAAAIGIPNVPDAISVNLSSNRIPGPTGISVLLSGLAHGGVAPTGWWVVPSSDPATGTIDDGTVSANGSFAWSATFAYAGTARIWVSVVDSVGSIWIGDVDSPLVPPLNVSAAIGWSSNGSGPFVDVQGSIIGGLPPFYVALTSNASEAWNITTTVDGPYAWRFPWNASGPVQIQFSVFDAYGQGWTFVQFLDISAANNSSIGPPGPEVPGPTAPSPTSSTGTTGYDGIAAIAAVAAVVGIFVVLFRRRRTHDPEAPPPAPDPIGTLKGILEPAEGAERSSVELLAEEAGVPVDLAHATIDRLIADGRIRAETDDEGAEVLAWSEPP